jgi:hypothetical protein
MNGRGAVPLSVTQTDGIPRPAARDAVRVREGTGAELEAWDSLVAGFPGHRVVHTRAWVASLEDAGFGRPLYLVCERAGQVVACFPGLLKSVGPLRLFGSPLPGWQSSSMGPAFDPDRVSTEAIFSAVLPYLRERWGVHHVEVLHHNLDGAAMNALGFRGEPVLTFRAPLVPGDAETTFRGLASNARRNIRRAERLGLTPRFETDDAFADEHYAQLRQVYAHGGYVIPFGPERVRGCFRRLRDAGRLLAIAVYLPDGRTNVASGMFTIEGGELLLWTWAHHPAYRWYRATELMTWTVMREAVARGCRTFDLMGGGDFKAKFGARPDTSKRRWVWSRYAWLGPARALAQQAFLVQQALRGRVAQAWLHLRTRPVVGEGE